MADPCKNCGTELFAGQRFCRACGNPTDTLDAGEAPTQQFADGAPSAGEATTRHMSPPDDWGARSVTHTAPQARPNTNPVGRPPDTYQPPQAYQAPPTSYQMPPQPPVWQPAQYAPQAAPARSGAPWAIVLAIILALMLGAVVGGRIIFKRIKDRIQMSQQQQPQAPPVARTSTVALNKGASVTINTISGDITIESWDKPQAEVQIVGGNNNLSQPAVKSGGDNNSLSLEAGGNPSVGFKLKVPSELGTITINTASGAVKLTNVAG